MPAEAFSLPDAAPLLAATAVFAAAGVAKGVVGLGLPTFSMAMLALFMPPAQAAALLILPSFFTNVWQVRPWAALGPVARRLAPMQCGACAGTLAGAWLLGAPAGAWAGVALGLALLAYAAWGLAGAHWTVPPRAERWLGPALGTATGLVTAATGVFVIPAVPYLQALGLRRDELIQAMGLSFTVSTLALAAGLALSTSYSGRLLGESALMLAPALAGMAAGQWLRQRLSPLLFKRCFLGTLALLGLHMVLRELLTL